MRRWKRIKEGNDFQVGDILILHRDDNTVAPEMMRIRDGYVSYSNTCNMVESDENGNTIRIYEIPDKLNEGTLVGGNMNKTEAMKRLGAIEAEAKALREIINKPHRLMYNSNKRYGLTFVG